MKNPARKIPGGHSLVLSLAAIFIFNAFPFAAAAEPQMLRVLNYNVWGAFFAKERKERIAAIPAQVARLNPDIIAFEEAFDEKHRQTLIDGLRECDYPVRGTQYTKRLYGTGILLVTRFEILSHEHFEYAVSGAILDPEHYAGKGVEHYVLHTPYGNLDVYLTHPIARFRPLYDQNGTPLLRDRRSTDRILEMEELARIVERTRNTQAGAVLVAGDLNTSPEMVCYQYFKKRSGLLNAFEVVHPGVYASTYDPSDTWVSKDWSRIDNIFYKNFAGPEGFHLQPASAAVVMTERVEIKPGRFMNLSDHYGMMADFEVINGDYADPAAVERSPGDARYPIGPQDIAGRELILNLTNLPAWQAWSRQVIDQALDRGARWDKRVFPAARIIALDPSPDRGQSLSFKFSEVSFLFSALSRSRCKDISLIPNDTADPPINLIR